MKIYRYIPNGRNYLPIIRTLSGQWWPDGIHMGNLMEELYPKAFGDYPWAHEGNRYDHAPADVALPDFPVFALHLPIVSPKAAEVLHYANMTPEPVPLTVSGKPFFAIQPRFVSVESQLSQAFVAEKSQGLAMPGGEVFHYYSRVFDETKIPGEFFSVPEFEPFSELFVTENLVEQVKTAGLTGLEYLELVYDDGPVVTKYPAPNIPNDEYTVRGKLEWELIEGRCSCLMAYDCSSIEKAMAMARREGYISFEYLRPEYSKLDVP